MRAARLIEALKPYLLLTLAAFLTGFLCYAGVGAPQSSNGGSELRPGAARLGPGLERLEPPEADLAQSFAAGVFEKLKSPQGRLP